MNLLHKETSPYLLQHANNPVDWYPWGVEALEKARKENKLMIVSIGYSACHWCHVMEHETFEDNEAAEVMNALYVNIKVDREERPDIDQIYMSALQLMNGTGGWPLNCILLPDGRPIYGGTYFKKKDWINILSNIAALHRNKPQDLIDYADKLIEGVRKMEFISEKSNSSEVPTNYLNEYIDNWMRFLDLENGGTQGAPKFPVPSNLSFLLSFEHFFPNEVRAYHIQNTLHKIARGGIYDQVGGGIYRYSVDGIWKIPHFEKMLYDQAQMISVYAEAYSKYKTPLYLNTLNSIINFCNTELYNSKEYSYYSALDADSEGVEGKYYCYTLEELKAILNTEAPLFIEYFQCTQDGNFEHGLNNLFLISNREEFFKKHNIEESDWESRVQECLKILYEYRKTRVRPGLDDKQLCAWNALMIKGLCDAYKVTSNDSYKEYAENAMRFILNKMYVDGKLYRSYKNGECKISAFLDDYAFSITALLSLFEITSNEDYLNFALDFTKYCMDEFYDDNSGLFWYTSSSSEELVARKQEYYDSVIPSSNASMQYNLKRLSVLIDNIQYEEIADQMMITMLDIMKKYPPSFSLWAKYILFNQVKTSEIIISGANAEEFYAEIAKEYLPNCLLSYFNYDSKLSLHRGRLVDEKTLIYVCQNKACELPTDNIQNALSQIGLHK